MLTKISGRQISELTAQDLGFSIAPRLNAAGRLEDMRKGVACLISEDEAECEALALELHELNDQRRQIEKQMGDDAKDVLAKVHWKEDVPDAICLYDESWHEGVIGILAGRLKERYHRPVVVFAQSLDKTLKGSVRSIEGIHIKDVFESMANRYPDLMLKYGGHAMAAGLSLLPSEFERFKQTFEETVRQQLSDEIKHHTLYHDGSLEPHECSLELAELLRQSGPWGTGFPEPAFEGVFRVLNKRYVGQVHLKLNLAFEHHHYPIEAIAFNAQDMIIESDKVRIVYKLTINAYMGLKKLQLVIMHLESA